VSEARPSDDERRITGGPSEAFGRYLMARAYDVAISEPDAPHGPQ
jgi:hypothetical protein